MDFFDLDSITRDKLRYLLELAKYEIGVYTPYHEEIKLIKKNREEYDGFETGCIITGIVFSFLITSVIIFSIFSNFKFSSILWFHGILFAVFVLLRIVWKKFSKEYDKTRLQELEQKEKEAIEKFKAVLIIPDDYCSEYALTTMLKFIDNKRAHSWKEVANLYEEHLHRMKMENNTKQILDELKIQTEHLSRIRSSANWGAVGAWAAATGIFDSN